MLPVLILGVLVLLGLLWVGVRLMLAGRQLDGAGAAGSGAVPVAPSGSVAAKVDARLQRARSAVELLVMPEVEHEELQPSRSAFRQRAQTYLVLGAGLVGLAGMLVIGFLLVL